MKGIKLCGECCNYNWKNHKCKIGCIDDSDAQASFYGDCPLPDVVPMTEFETLKDSNEHLAVMLMEAKADVAREIFEEVEKIILENTYPYFTKDGRPCNIWKPISGYDALDKLKNKYLGEKK